MSMTMLTALQLMGTAGAYIISTLFMPFLLLRKRLEKLPSSARLAACFTTGNFFIIVLVLILQLIHLSCRTSLIIGVLIPFPIFFLCRNKEAYVELTANATDFLQRIAERNLTIKIMLLQLVQKLRNRRYLRRFYKEILSVVAMLALVFFSCGLSSFESFGYGHPGLIGYNAQINELSKATIPSDGILSIGFNCMLYFLHTVYGIKTMTLLRLFGIVQTAALCLMISAFMKTICKSAFVPNLTAAGFLTLGLFVPSVCEQLMFALPQVFGAVFLPAAMLFLISYFKERQNKQKDRSSMSTGHLYLIFFGISVLMMFSALFGDNPSSLCIVYAVCMAGGFCLDKVIYLLFKKKKHLNVVSFGIFTIGTIFAFVCSLTSHLHHTNKEYVQSAAITCIENILHDNKGKDYTWTIVSDYNIEVLTGEYGLHYKTDTLIKNLNDPEVDTVKIKTPTVYVFIEKNLSEKRRSEMSDLCQWIQCIRRFYPDEVNVYLETDSFICYQIKQNGSFYNLAIDYRYEEEG